jgi:hypothetical protein
MAPPNINVTPRVNSKSRGFCEYNAEIFMCAFSIRQKRGCGSRHRFGIWRHYRQGEAPFGLVSPLAYVGGNEEGIVSGNDVEYTMKLKTPMGKMKVNVKGTVGGVKISDTIT